ncbi:LysE/ArgO family amino acid transporter [Rickettsia canadensis]|uniref:Lysine efflux permease n=1 Tax=Rickettsia canadensis str. CA410 TaxID=1105107 RepID=A0ABN4A9I0_RICCA|nr:LysE/ArgO family amino acid transporter [Rickettsia canadensis]AFB21023.1 lysine efflux permease [Rickettsia canadensis str. CA410]
MNNDILSAFLHGIVLALGLIVPLGVQNIFIFNQGAKQPKFSKVLPSIIAASICDTILICMAVLGISLLILEIPWLKLFIFIVGFIFLIYIVYNTWNQLPIDLTTNSQAFSTKKQILFAISVSILNPHAIMDTIVIIGTSALKYNGSAKIIFTLTCILISWIWFFSLAVAGYNIRKLNKSSTILMMINKIAAIIIWVVAVYIGVQLLHEIGFIN